MKVVKILWIDDSKSWAESVQDNLDIICSKYNIKFRFINVPNGEDVVFQCSSYDLDLIVMDYDMEPYTGDKYIVDVRNEEHLENIPIIFYSQNNSVELESLIVGVKGVKCLFRPFLEDEIKELYFMG